MRLSKMDNILSLLEPVLSADASVASDSTQTLTLPVIFARASALARQLTTMDVQTLALYGDNSVNWILIDFACQISSVCLLPIPTFFSVPQLEHVFTSVPADAIMTATSNPLPLLQSGDTVSIREKIASELEGYQLTLLSSHLNKPLVPENTGKITFTSGSTGQPKGVCLSNQQLLRQAKALVAATGLKHPRHLCLLPLSTLLENVAGIYAPLLAGGEIVVPSLGEIGFTGSSSLNPQTFLAIISDTQPNSIILTPELLQMMVSATEAGWKPPTSLTFAAVGGARVAPALLRNAQQAGIPAYEGYGLSECASVVSLNTPAQHKEDSSGRPLRHLSVEIEEDEIVICGNAMLGYLGEPESWGNERIHSGDLGVIDAEGFLHIKGRRKNLLISSFGRNISPEWVESECLAQAAISECVVFGDARPYCIALLSPDSPRRSDASLQQSVDRANEALPDYARIKRWQRLPQRLSTQNNLMTSNGRPKREAIGRHYLPMIDSLYLESPPKPNRFLVIKKGNGMSFFNTLTSATERDRSELYTVPMIMNGVRGEVSLDDYVSFLIQAYHHVKHTIPLLMATGSRLPEKYEWLRNAVAEYIEEELGHQEWILNDIAACGFDKEMVRQSQPNLATELMISHAYDTIRRVNPIGFFGMVHVLEGTSVSIADNAADSIRESLALPREAFSYLYTHGSIDIEHVKFFENLMNRIHDEQDQAQVIHSARNFYRLYADIFRSLDASHGIPENSFSPGVNHAAGK